MCVCVCVCFCAALGDVQGISQTAEGLNVFWAGDMVLELAEGVLSLRA